MILMRLQWLLMQLYIGLIILLEIGLLMLVVNNVSIMQMRSYKGFRYSKQAVKVSCGNNVLTLQRRPTSFKVLLILSQMQLVNDTFSSGASPRCLWATDLSISWLLK